MKRGKCSIARATEGGTADLLCATCPDEITSASALLGAKRMCVLSACTHLGYKENV